MRRAAGARRARATSWKASAAPSRTAKYTDGGGKPSCRPWTLSTSASATPIPRAATRCRNSRGGKVACRMRRAASPAEPASHGHGSAIDVLAEARDDGGRSRAALAARLPLPLDENVEREREEHTPERRLPGEPRPHRAREEPHAHDGDRRRGRAEPDPIGALRPRDPAGGGRERDEQDAVRMEVQ